MMLLFGWVFGLMLLVMWFVGINVGKLESSIAAEAAKLGPLDGKLGAALVAESAAAAVRMSSSTTTAGRCRRSRSTHVRSSHAVLSRILRRRLAAS
jgi:hypothetical protein